MNPKKPELQYNSYPREGLVQFLDVLLNSFLPLICGIVISALSSLSFSQIPSAPWWDESVDLFLQKVEDAPRLPYETHEVPIRLGNIPFEIGRISSVSRDRLGNYYILHRNLEEDPVVAVDSQGRFLRSWGKGLFTIPHSIRLDSEGNVWTVDSGSSQIYGFRSNGSEFRHIDVGEMPDIDIPFKGTSDIAFDGIGNLYIADGYGNSRVLKYDRSGNRLLSWGSPGRDNNQFNLVHGITIDESGFVYVADRENARIQKFTSDGELTAIWPDLGRVYSLYATGEDLWVGTQQLNLFGSGRNWIMKLDSQSGEILGVISAPSTHSIHFGPNCELAVAFSGSRLGVVKLWPGEACD